MNSIIRNTLIIGGCALVLASCNDNSWNDHLDGFEADPAPTDVQSLDYTLTDADYARVAANRFNKVIAAKAGVEKQLSNVGTQHYFTDVITPREYIPNLLTDSLFKYFTLSKGSSLKLTYNIATNLPEEVEAIKAATEYILDDTDYQFVYGSSTDYAASLSPSHNASKSIPKVLSDRFDDAEAGTYVIVNYNNSEVDPVFNQTPEPPVGTFTMSSVLGSATEGATLDISGVVTALCTRGFILTDKTGSILVYNGSFDYSAYKIGDQLVVSAEISSYGKGLQIAESSATIEKKGTQSVTYPEAHVFTAAELDQALGRTAAASPIFGQVTGTMSISGNYYNILIDGATAKGSLYYAPDDIKAKITDGEVMTITGYFISLSGNPAAYCNFVATDVKSATKSRIAPRRVVSVPSTVQNVVYYFNGSTWAPVANTIALNPADYAAMGQKYNNLSTPDIYIPTFLKVKYPYAQPEDKMNVVYKLYSGGTTINTCDEYEFDGSEWVKNNGVTQETTQFVYNDSGWVMDPNVTVTLPAGRGVAISTLFFQACVDWVYENVDRKLGSTSITSGVGYVTSYGNNEYYSGTSAYQGNVDLRPGSARTQYPAGYEGMTDDEVVAIMKKRFETEVMPGALSKLYPDAVPMEGMEVIYTINFGVYTGSSATYTIKFKVVGPAKFEFVECDWND